MPGSVYEGALPNTTADYIKKGETFSFKMTPSDGKFYFLFGEEWGKLRRQAELPVSSDANEYYPEGRRQLVFIYEFFSNQKAVDQKYLQQAVYAEEASVYKSKTQYNYLNNPYDALLNEANEITLLEKNNTFSIKAKGSLQIKEDKSGRREKILKSIKEVNQ